MDYNPYEKDYNRKCLNVTFTHEKLDAKYPSFNENIYRYKESFKLNEELSTVDDVLDFCLYTDVTKKIGLTVNDFFEMDNDTFLHVKEKVLEALEKKVKQNNIDQSALDGFKDYLGEQ